MGGGGGSWNPFKKNPLKRIEKEVKRGIDKPQNLIPWIGGPVLGPITGIIEEGIIEPIQEREEDLRKEMERRDQEQRQIEDDIRRERELTEERSSEVGRKARAVARRLQRARKRSTILTSGLGVPGEPPTTQKTLLGR